jgi:hypothetical protein
MCRSETPNEQEDAASEELATRLDAPLSPVNHKDKNLLRLALEHIQEHKEVRNYDMDGAQLFKAGGLAWLNVPGLAENRPSVVTGDELLVANANDSRCVHTPGPLLAREVSELAGVSISPVIIRVPQP